MRSKSVPDPRYYTDLNCQERALHYGDGLFETLLKTNDRLPMWDLHYARLGRGCGRLAIPLPEENWLRQQVTDKSRQLRDAVIKIIVSRGRGGRGLELPEQPIASVFVLSYPWAAPVQNEIWAALCKTRLPLNSNLAGIKHLNRLDYVLAAIELQAIPDASEGILCDLDGFLVEGLISNLFFIVGSQIFTPSLKYAGVDGIQRQRIIDYCQRTQIPIVEGRFKPELLLDSDECFLSNSVRGIMPITKIDRQQFNVGEYTSRLMSALNTPVNLA